MRYSNDRRGVYLYCRLLSGDGGHLSTRRWSAYANAFHINRNVLCAQQYCSYCAIAGRLILYMNGDKHAHICRNYYCSVLLYIIERIYLYTYRDCGDLLGSTTAYYLSFRIFAYDLNK